MPLINNSHHFLAQNKFYQGECTRQGKCHGQGLLRDSLGATYKGEFRNGQAHGWGRAIYPMLGSYEGEYEEGAMQGKGRLFGPDGNLIYEGGFEKGQYHGRGKLFEPDGTVLEGEFQEGNFNGNGKKIYRDGSVSEGQFQNGALNGCGAVWNPNGSLLCRGEFIDDLLNGQGELHYSDGLTFTGEFWDDELHGKGKIEFPEGFSVSGTFAFGHRIDSNYSEVGGYEFLSQLFSFNESSRIPSTNLGILIDVLRRIQRLTEADDLIELLQRLVSKTQNSYRESLAIHQNLLEGISSLLPYGFHQHCMLLRLVPNGDWVLFEIYNSGEGLSYHPYDPTSGKYQTVLRIQAPLNQVTANLIESLLNFADFKTAFEAYQIIFLLPHAVLLPPDLTPTLWGRPQKGDNCSLKSLLVYLKHKMGVKGYKRFLFELCLAANSDYPKHEENKNLLTSRKLNRIAEKIFNLRYCLQELNRL